MIDAGISEGDVVFIRKQPDVPNGQIAAVRIGDEATLKRVYWDGTTLTLMPANPSYAPRTYTGETLRDVQIEGRAIGYLHLY
jgi:repressor LexA